MHQLTFVDRGHSRPGSKETNMNQICTNESALRPQPALRTTGQGTTGQGTNGEGTNGQARSWTRFVHALDGPLDALVDTLLTWQRRHKDRMHLMSLDDRLLRDIGISYADVDRESSKPFWRG
jgi:uncharacterized protein YjiS (DUF1127 family)